MFRSFEATIDGRTIPWIRRRDQEIVKFLLLQPLGCATRTEIAAAFWPDADFHSAVQNIRTACSNIRKALAAVVGRGEVDLYFRAAPDLRVDLAHVTCDVLRFSAHIREAEACVHNADTAAATRHFRAAERLYSGDLLEHEGAAPWAEQYIRKFREQYMFALECLAVFALEHDNDCTTAQRYAMRATGGGSAGVDFLIAALVPIQRAAAE
jgi:DNA-binding SARP family transcriptional activator